MRAAFAQGHASSKQRFERSAIVQSRYEAYRLARGAAVLPVIAIHRSLLSLERLDQPLAQVVQSCSCAI